MTAHKVMKMPYARIEWRAAWRNLRKCMKDPAELAWRLRHDFKFTPPSSYSIMHNHACTVMYERSMPVPANRLGK